jgi:acid phosphatase
MEYLNSLISKWMPEDSKRLAVDSHPRLSGVMDTINATLAHGPKTRLPSKFYDSKGREIIDKIGVEEWFSGYKESEEYRRVGIGALVGDIVSRMVGHIKKGGNDGMLEIGGEDGNLGGGRGGEKLIKFTMSGCHDTTLAALLSSLGAFEGEQWPPYTSHVAIELFSESANSSEVSYDEERTVNQKPPTFRFSLFEVTEPDSKTAGGIERKPITELKPAEKEKLKGRYVRVIYNDRPMVIPGCRLPGNHFRGDESFCTLVSILTIYDVPLC